MNAFRNGKGPLAVALSVLLAVNGLPSVAFAGGQTTQGLCQHHPSHMADCGYEEAQPCGHKVNGNGGGSGAEEALGGGHTEDCYTLELSCGYVEERELTASGSDSGHTHTQKCYKLDCPHERGEHDDLCGYVEGRPCEYICEFCKEPATEPNTKPEDVTEPAACTLTEGCTLAGGHEGQCATESEGLKKETICTLTEGCTLPHGHEGQCATESEALKKEIACTLTQGCTLPHGHEGQCVAKPSAAGAGTITITAFDELARPVIYVPLNSTWEDLILPATLDASGYTVSGDPGSTPEPESISIENVTWEVFEKDGSPADYIDPPPPISLHLLAESSSAGGVSP